MSVEVSLIRGGTSKGVFLRLDALPAGVPARDAFALRLLGSPDPMQLDGLGGTHSSTSKIMAVGTAAQARALGYEVAGGCDLAYLFGQVGVAQAVVDWRGNCGNLTAAVPVYALHEGLIPAAEPVTVVQMANLNNGARVTARVPVRDGAPRADGDFVNAGVPGTGARIDITFTLGDKASEHPVLPTGKAAEQIKVDGVPVPVSILDVTNPVVILRATSLGLTGGELPADLNARPGLLATLERIRAQAAVRCGLVASAGQAASASPAVPRVILVSAPHEHRLVSGVVVPAGAADIVARTTSMGVIHHAFTGTGLMDLAAAALIPGTVIEGLVAGSAGEIFLAHPKGVVPVAADVGAGEDGPVVRSVSVARTARRLLRGVAFI